MMKKKSLAILFNFISIAIFLAHGAIPHHHHEGNTQLLIEEHTEVQHHSEDHSHEDHHSEGHSHSSICCDLMQDFVPRKVEVSIVLSEEKPFHADYSFDALLSSYSNALLFANKAREWRPDKVHLISQCSLLSVGLRAPPCD